MTIECQDHSLLNYDCVEQIWIDKAAINGRSQITAKTISNDHPCLGVYESEERANNALTNLKYSLNQNRAYTMPKE